MHTFRCIPANTIRRTVDQHSKVSNFRSLTRPNIELTLWQDTCDCTPAVLPHCSSQRDAYKAWSHNILHWLYTLYFPQKLHRLNVSLMLGQQCRRWTSIKPGITGYLVYCCAALYIVYPALKEHHLIIILLFVNSIQNKVMALVSHILVTSN